MPVLGEMPRPCTRCLLPSRTPKRLFRFGPAPAEASRVYRNTCESGVCPLVSVARSRLRAQRLLSCTIAAWRTRSGRRRARMASRSAVGTANSRASGTSSRRLVLCRRSRSQPSSRRMGNVSRSAVTGSLGSDAVLSSSMRGRAAAAKASVPARCRASQAAVVRMPVSR